MEKATFTYKTYQRPSERQIQKKEVEHQAMMGLVIEEGYAKGVYLGLWGRIIKESKITEFQLKKLIQKANTLTDYSSRGYVRNRLQDKMFE